ncbi:MAG: type II toxin-antitoxin system prevent-host-death family antitoxin [Acidobacteriota bacterium]
MPTEVTYTYARAHLATLCSEVAADRGAVTIHRRGAEDVALVAAAELRSLLETAHLLRSPRNAQRLLKALARAQAQTVTPGTLDEVRRELGLAEKA